ncbi:MAG: HD domain-containing protein [Candidatus Hodarchaeales archaeon]
MVLAKLPSPKRVIRDPVHGNIDIYPLEEIILETKAFQRLRFISQLSLCSLVYPGAVHNRFSHSLGAMHLAGQMYNSLVTNSPNEEFEFETFQAVRLATMLHDIGHGPFSHVFERAVSFFKRKIKDIETFHHENMSLKIVRELFKDKLDNDIFNFVTNLLEKKNLPSNKSYLTQIISSEFDADRADFLLRDSYYAGVSYGQFELPRLLETMVLTNHPENDKEQIIAFKKKSIMALENFIFSRANSYRAIYFHHTNLVGDAMISRGVYELLKRKMFPLIALTDPKEFIKWNDTRLYGMFHEIANNETVDSKNPNIETIHGLLFRNLWKRLNIRNHSLDYVYEVINGTAEKNEVDPDLILEKITVKKIPYTHLPYRSVLGHPQGIFLLEQKNKSNKLLELSDVMKIQVPEDFIINQQILLHPRFIHEIQSSLDEN